MRANNHDNKYLYFCSLI